jgi:hypothetical protein
MAQVVERPSIQTPVPLKKWFIQHYYKLLNNCYKLHLEKWKELTWQFANHGYWQWVSCPRRIWWLVEGMEASVMVEGEWKNEWNGRWPHVLWIQMPATRELPLIGTWDSGSGHGSKAIDETARRAGALKMDSCSYFLCLRCYSSWEFKTGLVTAFLECGSSLDTMVTLTCFSNGFVRRSYTFF